VTAIAVYRNGVMQGTMRTSAESDKIHYFSCRPGGAMRCISTRCIPVEVRAIRGRTMIKGLKRLYVGFVWIRVYTINGIHFPVDKCCEALGLCSHVRLHRCAVCQAWFLAHCRAKACSDACKKVRATAALKRFRRRERKNRERPSANCKVCGEPFEPQRSTRLYCSDACQQKAYRERKAAPHSLPSQDG
jgi:hypothetical protein